MQERDDEKVANEKAKNSLESFIFGIREWLEVSEVLAVSSEDQREEIRGVVSEVADWFDEEGYYNAETSVSDLYPVAQLSLIKSGHWCVCDCLCGRCTRRNCVS